MSSYLNRYAEPEAALVSCLSGDWGQVVVIPACRELGTLEGALASLKRAATKLEKATLAIVVVNARAQSPPDVHFDNMALLEKWRLRMTRSITLMGGVFTLGAISKDVDLLLVDRASPNRHLPDGQGVGLARKIGCDIALALHQSDQVSSPWIWSTDADVILPRDYLSAPLAAPVGTSAVTLAFVHQPEKDQLSRAACVLYDLSLRYYALGLASAGSRYAFHTVGSTLVIGAEQYAKVRGFPKRLAGEDFYLLNKLAKLGPVFRASNTPLVLSGRRSDRVPFGTGPAVSRLATSSASSGVEEMAFELYNPEVFNALRRWHEELRRLPSSGEAERCLSALGAVLVDAGASVMEAASLIESLGATKAVNAAVRASSKPSVRQRHLDTWWDGFKSLKFVHGLRARCLPSLSWSRALNETSWFEQEVGAHSEEAQRLLMARERALLTGPSW